MINEHSSEIGFNNIFRKFSALLTRASKAVARPLKGSPFYVVLAFHKNLTKNI